LINYSI